MKNFRSELLEELLNHSGEYVSIMNLVAKHCEEGNDGDATSKCRTSVNELLIELEQMGWITYSPPGGLSKMYSFNLQLGKREYLNEKEVMVKLTTTGEIGYKKMRKENRHQSMEDYKLAAFRALREDGNEIGDEVVWDNIAQKANIPQGLWDDVKNILIHQGYIQKTTSAQGMGDLVRANSSVVAAIYELENKLPQVQINQNFHAGRDINQSGNTEISSGNLSSEIVSPVRDNSKRKVKKEIIIGVVITVLGGLLTWGIIELIKVLS